VTECDGYGDGDGDSRGRRIGCCGTAKGVKVGLDRIAQHSTAQHSTAEHSIAQHSTA
jgi:hypothetical protein